MFVYQGCVTNYKSLYSFGIFLQFAMFSATKEAISASWKQMRIFIVTIVFPVKIPLEKNYFEAVKCDHSKQRKHETSSVVKKVIP